MTFLEFLKSEKLTYREISLRLNLSISSIHCFCFGKRTPSNKSMKKIIKETKGMVMPNDFYKK